jgi:hypothetical protein
LINFKIIKVPTFCLYFKKLNSMTFLNFGYGKVMQTKVPMFVLPFLFFAYNERFKFYSHIQSPYRNHEKKIEKCLDKQFVIVEQSHIFPPILLVSVIN